MNESADDLMNQWLRERGTPPPDSEVAEEPTAEASVGASSPQPADPEALLMAQPPVAQVSTPLRSTPPAPEPSRPGVLGSAAPESIKAMFDALDLSTPPRGTEVATAQPSPTSTPTTAPPVDEILDSPEGGEAEPETTVLDLDLQVESRPEKALVPPVALAEEPAEAAQQPILEPPANQAPARPRVRPEPTIDPHASSEPLDLAQVASPEPVSTATVSSEDVPSERTDLSEATGHRVPAASTLSQGVEPESPARFGVAPLSAETEALLASILSGPTSPPAPRPAASTQPLEDEDEETPDEEWPNDERAGEHADRPDQLDHQEPNPPPASAALPAAATGLSSETLETHAEPAAFAIPSPTTPATNSDLAPQTVTAPRQPTIETLTAAAPEQAPASSGAIPASQAPLDEYLFEAPPSERGKLTALMILSLLASAASCWWALGSHSLAAILMTAVLGLITSLAWAARASRPTSRVTLTGTVVTVERAGTRTQIDLADPRLELLSDPDIDAADWRAVFSQPGTAPVVVDASMVDPFDFLRVVRRRRTAGAEFAAQTQHSG